MNVTPPTGRRDLDLRNVLAVGAGVAVALGVALRFWVYSDLWLDEALTVNIARLPLRHLPDALRHDGAPPLYYVILHGWMRVFGETDFAVRALSGVFAVLALPLTWLAGKRVGGPSVAWSVLLLLASCPFAIRYATETRMYSLVVFLTLAGAVLLIDALDRPTTGRLALVGVVTALLLLTHYWSIFLLAVIALALLWRARRCTDAAAATSARRCLFALVCGGLLFVPWLPVFAFQARHTGAPWAEPARLGALVDTITLFAGGHDGAGAALGLLFTLLLALALLARPVGAERAELDPSWPSPARGPAFVVVGTLAMAMLVALIGGSPYASRYASVVLGPFMIWVGLGVAAIPGAARRRSVLAVAVVLGLFGALSGVGRSRTQAAEVVRAAARAGRPGDLVAFCPDQLEPSVDRLLGPAWERWSFPEGPSPARIDWVNYRQRMQAGDPAAFASRLVSRAGTSHNIFLVWTPGYRTLAHQCEELASELVKQRSADVLLFPDASVIEPMTLERFPAG